MHTMTYFVNSNSYLNMSRSDLSGVFLIHVISFALSQERGVFYAEASKAKMCICVCPVAKLFQSSKFTKAEISKFGCKEFVSSLITSRSSLSASGASSLEKVKCPITECFFFFFFTSLHSAFSSTIFCTSLFIFNLIPN